MPESQGGEGREARERSRVRLAGDPTLGIDGGASCSGALAQATFTYGLCACTTIQESESLTTDGFDSTLGGPDGGLGANVGANTGVSWSGASSIGGLLWTPGNVTSSNAGTVRGDLHLGGTLGGGGSFTVDGNAFDVHALPGNARVLGAVEHVSSVASPCDCASPLPIAARVAAHRGIANDDATIGLSPGTYVGNNPSRLDLPCGSYYLTQVNAAQPLTLAVHGHAALYVDGNVSGSNGLAFTIDAGATLDLFVAGTFNASNGLALGSISSPAHCRAYVAGSSFNVSGTTTWGCNVYAPDAFVTLSTPTTAYGSLFADAIQASGNATVHFDTSITRAADECCSASTCDDGNPCTVDACAGDGTCSHAPVANGTACTGTNACEQTYSCQSGACVGSKPVTCAASDACHVAGTCNPSSGKCSNPAAPDGTTCDDGNACTQTDTCQAGTCTGSNPVTCAASDACHVAGACSPSTGKCSNPAAPNGTTCNDGNACTQSDACQAGTCLGSNPVTCTASDACHVVGVCDATTGTCSNPAAPDGTTCNDGKACTQTDACRSGMCVGSSPVTCTASDACHVAGTCDPTTGSCSNPAAPDGTTCNDGNACTQSDACQAGTCTGSNPVTCTASDACHVVGTCDPSTGSCSNPAAPDGTTCNDGNACTQSDACQAGTCTGSNAVSCPGVAAPWTVVASLATARVQHAMTELATGDVLATGGSPDSAGDASLASAEIYRSATGVWTPAASMTVARWGHTATRLPSGKVLVAGGTSNGVDVASTEIYDPTADAWTPAAPMNAARVGNHAVLLASGRVLVVGVGSGLGASSEVYDPVSNAWSAVPGSVPGGGDRDVVVVLADDRVLAAGGATSDPAVPSTDAGVYDPGKNAWSAVAAMPTARMGAVAALLLGGNVVVAGGSGVPLAGQTQGQPLSDALVFDPLTNAWTSAGSMCGARSGGAVAQLPNGKVLVVGGPSSGGDTYTLLQGWSSAASATTFTGSVAAATATGAILVAGGVDRRAARRSLARSSSPRPTARAPGLRSAIRRAARARARSSQTGRPAATATPAPRPTRARRATASARARSPAAGPRRARRPSATPRPASAPASTSPMGPRATTTTPARRTIPARPAPARGPAR